MKILFTIIVAFLATSAFTQTTYISVAVAKIKANNKCVSKTCLPDYEIVSGPTPGTKYNREAKEALEKKYGEQYKNSDLFVEVISNTNSYGSFLTILSTNVSDNNGCKRFLYGVGFGKDKGESLKSAEKYLESIIWNGGKKFTYKIVKQQMLDGATGDISNEKTTSESTEENDGMGKLKRKS